MKGKKWCWLSGIFALALLVSGIDGFHGLILKHPNLNVQLRAQHRDYWCWAASTEMISEYLGRRISQCDSYSFVHSSPWCSENCSWCDFGWGPGGGAYLEDMKENWQAWDFKFTHRVGSLSWREVTEQISSIKSPFFVLWYYEGGGGHVVVVNGYSQPAGRFLVVPLNRAYVYYKDPWPPDCEQSEDWLTCSSVPPGGDEAVCTIVAFVADGEHYWGDTLYHFVNTNPISSGDR